MTLNSHQMSNAVYFIATQAEAPFILKAGVGYRLSSNRNGVTSNDDSGYVIIDSKEKKIDKDTRKYVFLHSFSNIEDFVRFPSKVVVQINSSIKNRVDTLKVITTYGNVIGYLKSFAVNRESVEVLHVNSKSIAQELEKETSSIPVKVSPQFFHSEEKSEEKIKIVKGNILNSKMQTVVNTVNCVGVMGKGIALAYKKAYPEMYKDYRERCQRGEVKLGFPYCYKLYGNRWVLNFPTKGHWKQWSQTEDIEAGLEHLLQNFKKWGITSIAIPPLGCGNGGLDWNDVFPLIMSCVKKMSIPAEIYVPFHLKNARNYP